ncbi:arginase family protein [uncultured Amnibacterium sp.]|uniref:arginase family protein n=1 Tax=uncultured Amnibacterium sp. TaxID=1631851 RepID=UPI0035CC4698
MTAKFVVVPQWQGSASSRSMRLIDGAEAIRGDLPSGATTTVEIPLGAGDAVDTGVHRYSTLAVVRERLSMVLANIDPADTPIVIGGDCGVELAAVEHAAARAAAAGERLGLVWFDANPDLHTPDSSPSGAFCGMVLRALLGEGAPGLVAERPLAPDDVVLAGTRSEDDGEAEYLASSPITLVRAEELDGLADAVDALGCDRVYLHIDLDVLDPGEFAGLTDPQPFGVSLGDLTKAISVAVGSRRLAGAGIAMFAPATPAAANPDLPAVLRILSAVTAPVRARA